MVSNIRNYVRNDDWGTHYDHYDRNMVPNMRNAFRNDVFDTIYDQYCDQDDDDQDHAITIDKEFDTMCPTTCTTLCTTTVLDFDDDLDIKSEWWRP